MEISETRRGCATLKKNRCEQHDNDGRKPRQRTRITTNNRLSGRREDATVPLKEWRLKRDSIYERMNERRVIDTRLTYPSTKRRPKAATKDNTSITTRRPKAVMNNNNTKRDGRKPIENKIRMQK